MNHIFQTNVSGFLKPTNVPKMPASMERSVAIKHAIPKGLEHMFTVSEGEKNSIILRFVNSENSYDTEIEIPEIIFNPKALDVSYPKFLFQVSTFRKGDYFGKDSNLILNNNQMLYILIQNRCYSLSRYEKHFIGLLRSDIRDLKAYVEYIKPNSYNCKLKVACSHVILDVWDRSSSEYNLVYKKDRQGNELGVGDIMRPDADLGVYSRSIEELMAAVFRDVPLQCSSESMLSKSNSIVMYPHNKDFYRAPGYSLVTKGENSFAVSMYAAKQNLPARWKTHLIADAYEFVNPDKKTIIQQDSIMLDDGSIAPKDNCLTGAYIIYMDMSLETGKFVCGEIEQSVKTAKQLVRSRQAFESIIMTISVAPGDEFKKVRNVVVGYDVENNPISIRGDYHELKIVSVDTDPVHNATRIVFECILEAGTSRITSHSGLKGFTKIRPNLGHITLPNGETREVDLIAGMNAVKAKQNTIVLSRACLAVKDGLFVTENGYLNSLDQKQVNDAASTVQKLKYTDENGIDHQVWAGYIQYSVTELGRVFAEDKKQSFSFEAGKYLEQQSDKSLFNHIFSEYVDPEAREIVIELHKILHDNVGIYAMQDGIPIWEPKDLPKEFAEKDLVLSSISRWPSNSKILDEDLNKGFCIDLRYRGGPIVRMPSAKLLNAFSSVLNNGKYIYHPIVVNASKCLQNCVQRNAQGGYNYGFLWSAREGHRHSVEQYMRTARGMLHYEKEMGMVLSQTLIKPKVFGMNAKQMADITIPQGVVVILDEAKRLNMMEVAYGIRDNNGKRIDVAKEKVTEVYANSLVGELTSKKHDVYGLIIRNPMLWRTQVQKVEVWGRQQYADHLMEVHGIDIDKYLSTRYCQHLIMISVQDCIGQHSDLDGDLLPLFIPGPEGQKSLKNFVLENIDPDEAQWTKDYYVGEYEANEDLHAEPVYKLHVTQLNYSDKNMKSYSRFFMNAAIAKGNIGPATFDIWTLYGILQLYKKFCEIPELREKFLSAWFKRVPSAPRNLSDAEINKMCYIYTRLVEEFVINAIKHMEGGSSGFEIYYLRNMTKDDATATRVATQLSSAPFNMSTQMVGKFMDIVRWSFENDAMKAIKAYIRRFNKGIVAEETMFDEAISDHTYFGGLVKVITEMNKKIVAARNDNFFAPQVGYKPWSEYKRNVDIDIDVGQEVIDNFDIDNVDISDDMLLLM